MSITTTFLLTMLLFMGAFTTRDVYSLPTTEIPEACNKPYPGRKYRKYKDECPLASTQKLAHMDFGPLLSNHTVTIETVYRRQFGTCMSFRDTQPTDSLKPKNWGDTKTEMALFPPCQVNDQLQGFQQGWNASTKKGHTWTSPRGNVREEALEDALGGSILVKNTFTAKLDDIISDAKKFPSYFFYSYQQVDETTIEVTVSTWIQRMIVALTYFDPNGGPKFQAGPTHLAEVKFVLHLDKEHKRAKYGTWCNNAAPRSLCANGQCTGTRIMGDCIIVAEKNALKVNHPPHVDKVEGMPDVKFDTMVETFSSLFNTYTTSFHSLVDVSPASYKATLFWGATIVSDDGQKPDHFDDPLEVNLFQETKEYHIPVQINATGSFDEKHVQYSQEFELVNPGQEEKEDFQPYSPFAIVAITQFNKQDWEIPLQNASFSLIVHNSTASQDISHMARNCTTGNLEGCDFGYDIAPHYANDSRLMWLIQMDDEAWPFISDQTAVLELLVELPLRPKESEKFHLMASEEERVFHKFVTTTTQ